MPRKSLNDPMRKGDLRGTWERCPTPEVRALLWEIDRLHQIVVLMEELCRYLEGKTTNYMAERAVRNLFVILDQEPPVRWKRIQDRKREATYGNRNAWPTIDPETEPDGTLP